MVVKTSSLASADVRWCVCGHGKQAHRYRRDGACAVCASSRCGRFRLAPPPRRPDAVPRRPDTVPRHDDGPTVEVTPARRGRARRTGVSPHRGEMSWPLVARLVVGVLILAIVLLTAMALVDVVSNPVLAPAVRR